MNGWHYLTVVDYYLEVLRNGRTRYNHNKGCSQGAENNVCTVQDNRHHTVRLWTTVWVSGSSGTFCQDLGIQQVTSSLYYPRSNGEAERAMQLANSLAKKALNLEQALLAQHATPGAEGFFPAELFMRRRLRTSVPTREAALKPEWKFADVYKTRNSREKTRQASDCNLHGTVLGLAGQPRSYVVETECRTVRRTKGPPPTNRTDRKPGEQRSTHYGNYERCGDNR